MITEIYGDILKEPSSTWIVVPINCYGIAGAGLAKQWKERCPEAYEQYRLLCNDDALKPGGTWWITTDEGRFILAATKGHWKPPSKIEWIESILEDLADKLVLTEDPISIAVPPLGCGLGGLDWDQVQNLIYYWLADHAGGDRIDRHTIIIYPPQ